MALRGQRPRNQSLAKKAKIRGGLALLKACSVRTCDTLQWSCEGEARLTSCQHAESCSQQSTDGALPAHAHLSSCSVQASSSDSEDDFDFSAFKTPGGMEAFCTPAPAETDVEARLLSIERAIAATCALASPDGDDDEELRAEVSRLQHTIQRLQWSEAEAEAAAANAEEADASGRGVSMSQLASLCCDDSRLVTH